MGLGIDREEGEGRRKIRRMMERKAGEEKAMSGWQRDNGAAEDGNESGGVWSARDGKRWMMATGSRTCSLVLSIDGGKDA